MIPSCGLGILKTLKSYSEKYGNIRLIRNSEIHTTNSPVGSYKNIHLIIKGGKQIFKSSKKHKYQETPKLIINGLGENYIYFDEGKYGVSEKPIIIINPTNITKIFVNSYIFQYLIKSLKLIGNNFPLFIEEYIPNFSTKENLKNLDDIENLFGKKDLEALLKFKKKFNQLKFTNIDIPYKYDKTKRTKRVMVSPPKTPSPPKIKIITRKKCRKIKDEKECRSNKKCSYKDGTCVKNQDIKTNTPSINIPKHMINCPPEFTNDPNANYQEINEMCLRHYEENKPKLKTKPTPSQYCTKIKTQKNCEAMKRCEFTDRQCKSRKRKIIRKKKKPETDK